MKAISLWQPWASLVAIGAKRIETRSWSTSYRGPLAIHAARRWTRDQRRLCLTDHFAAALEGAGLKRPGCRAFEINLPLGAVIATCEIAHCVEIAPGRRKLWGEQCFIPPEAPELLFGNYAPGRFAWILENVKLLEEPIPAVGRQALFNWTPRADRRRA